MPGSPHGRNGFVEESVKKASEHLTKIISDSEHALKKTEERYEARPHKDEGKENSR